MKTLFSKILLAQVVAVVLALLVVTLITRVSLNQGFKDFLERQEATVLQTLALADAGALHVKKNEVNLSSLVCQCVGSFRQRLEARQIQVDMELAQNVIILADQPKIRQVLNNLMENSSRYVVGAGKIRVSLRQNQADAELLLEDSGPGLEDEQIDRLFERFYRVDSSRSRVGGGTGLGLSICKNIIEAHGGSIRVEHSALGGLKIRITLPA